MENAEPSGKHGYFDLRRKSTGIISELTYINLCKFLSAKVRYIGY